MSLSALPTALLIPPVNLLGSTLLGLAAARWGGRRLRRAGTWLAGLSLAGLLLLSLPIVADSMIYGLETGLPLVPPAAAPPQAIVILSAEEADTVDAQGRNIIELGPMTLVRLHTGAALHRRSGLPVLVTGGTPRADAPPIALLMAQELGEDFATPVRWVENKSLDTWENAEFSAPMLRAAGINSVWLVTHAWHTRRAIIAFRHFGITVTAAPVLLDRRPKWRASALIWQTDAFIPHASSWLRSYYAIHEWIGCAWYALRAR